MKLNKYRLELAMARACMNARDLRQNGISSTTISRAINGEDLTVKTVGRIARTLNVDVAEIIEEVKQ